jgi:tetratricopeptide (TPR) repeat protein
MSIEALLDFIREKFSPSESQKVVQCLSQDPLIWRFIQDEGSSLAYFKSASPDLQSYAPGSLAVWHIEQKTGIKIEDIKKEETQLPQAIKKLAEQSFTTVLNTGLPPTDLFTAGLLALALREKRQVTGSWSGITDEMFLKGNNHSVDKNYKIWQTPMACLLHFCSDFDSLISEVLSIKNERGETAVIPLFIHALLANPTENNDLEDKLFNTFQHLPIDLQLNGLQWLAKNQRHKLSQSLAKHLLQTRKNIEHFSKTFSELEAFETFDKNIDPLQKRVNFSLPEEVNRLAAFYHYSGDSQKTSETYQRSSDLLNFLRSQTLFQSIISEENKKPHSQWVQIINTVPNALHARFFYIQELIDNMKFDEAHHYLKELHDSPEKNYLEFQLQSMEGETKSHSFDLEKMIPDHQPDLEIRFPSYYVHPVRIDNRESLLKYAQVANGQQNDEWVDNILEDSLQDPSIVKLARDYYESAQQLGKATVLTSYLERLEPGKKEHKQELARLYCDSNRWNDAFVSLQALIKSESQPEMQDLERFAESALKTDHIDMGISICHNIIKQDPLNSKALILLGDGYMQKGDMVKAVQHMEQVVEMIPEEAKTWLTLARIWQENSQTDRAFEVLSKGVLAVPNSPTLLRAIGKAHLEKQAPADALTYLTKAHEIDPTNIEGLLDLAQTKHQLGQNEQALQLLEPLETAYQQDPLVAKLLGLILLAMDNKSSAEPKLLFAAEHFPEDIETALTTANLILSQQELSLEGVDEAKLEKLESILENALLNEPDNFQIRLNLADIKRLSGKQEQALESYRLLTEASNTDNKPEQWRLAYGLGKSATSLGNFDLAMAALQDASSKKPGNIMVMHALAEAYQANDFEDKAHQIARSTLKLAPQEVNNILWYAEFMAKRNDMEEALKALTEALQMNPNRADLQLRLAKTLLSTGSIGEAVQHIKDLINHHHADVKNLHQAGYLCVELNEPELALKAFQKAVKLTDKFNPSLLMDLAFCYSLNDQPTKAIDVLELPKETFMTYPQLAVMKSDFLSNLGQYGQAYEILKELVHREEKEGEIGDIELSAITQSPLLYSFDFTNKGFLHRYGQLSRCLGHFQDAQQSLSKALLLDPEDRVLQNALLESYIAALNFEQAVEVAGGKQFDGSNTSEVAIICNLVEISLIQNDLKTAETMINSVSQSDIQTPRLLALRSIIASEHKDIDLANHFYQESMNKYQQYYGHPSSSLRALFEQSMTLSSISEAAFRVGEYQFALDYQQKALDLFQNQPFHLWRTIMTLNHSAEAQQIAEVLSITEHAPGKSFLNKENLKQSQEMIDKIQDFLPEDQVMCLKARTVAAFTGKWPLSLNADSCLMTPDDAASVIISTDSDDLIKDILGAYPNNPDVLRAYGIYSLKNNNVDAIPLIEKIIPMDILNPVNHILLALLQKDEPKLAVSSLETALGFWPNEPEWHALAAELHKTTGNIELAGKHIKQALSIRPENGDYWEKSGEIKLELNDLNEAKQDLEKSVSLKSQEPAIWMKMANVNRRLGNSPEAIENIRKAGELDPGNMDILSQEIKVLLEQHRYGDAEKKSEELLAQNPTMDSLRILLADSQSKQGKFSQALETLDSSLSKDRKGPDLSLAALKIKKEQDGIESSLPDLVKLADEYPSDGQILITLTDWLIQSNRLKKAEETAQTILRIIPEQADVHLMLGRLQRKNGQLDQAISHLSDAIRIDPFLVEAYIVLGKTYQDRNNLEEAIKVFQKASQANPADPRPYYHAGMAMKECKNYSDAEVMLKQAKKYAPDDSNIIRQLGVITALNLIHNLRETR